MTAWIRAGTIALVNGSATITGTATTWINQVRVGDVALLPDGKLYEVGQHASAPVGTQEATGSNTLLTINPVYAGATASGQPYAILPVSTAWSDIAVLSHKISNFLANIVGFNSGNGVPSNAIGTDGSAYLRDDIPEIYRKVAGVWGTPISLVGVQGPVGPGYKGTSTTSTPVTAGAKTITTQAGLAYVVGTRVRIASNAGPTNYLEGITTAYNTGTGILTFTPDRTGGSGTFADWNVTLAGDTGPIGPAGAASTALSSTSLLIVTGSKAFTIAAGLSFANGQRVRAASAANTANFMEGRCSYAGTVLTVTVDVIGGSGTFADWSIGPAGERGIQGIQGAQGIQGVQGVTGASYTATSATSLLIEVATKVFTTQAGLAYLPGAKIIAASAAAPSTNNMRGTVTGYAGTTLTVAVQFISGSGTYADWTLNLHGEQGPQGDIGPVGPPPVFATSSVTSNTVSAGIKLFTVAAGLGYGGGERVRIVSDADLNKWMLAVVTDYTSPSLTVTVDDIGPGTGTATDWSIVLTGERGAQGAAGGLSGLAATKGGVPAADGTSFAALIVGLNGQSLIADSTQTYGLKWDAIDNGICQGRLTLTAGVPVLTSSVSAATSILFTPYIGASIALYNGTSWRVARFSEASLSLAGFTAASNYDIFAYDNAGALALEALIWTNSTTRATALVLQDGVYVKSGVNTRRYLGTIRIGATTGQCSWTYGSLAALGGAGNLGIWNYYNRIPVASQSISSTDSWTYAVANTWRAANASTTHRISFVTGLAEDSCTANYDSAGSASASGFIAAAVGVNSTTAPTGSTAWVPVSANSSMFGNAVFVPPVGFNFVQAIEFNSAAVSATFYGDSGAASGFQKGTLTYSGRY